MITLTTYKKLLSRVFSIAGLAAGLGFAGAASATQYDLYLTAVGGAHDGEALYDFGVSTIDVAEVIDWSVGGTTGVFNATAISIDYFGTVYDLGDAIGPVTVEWNDGVMVGASYDTADFSLALTPTFNTKEWQGTVTVNAVPLPGAMVLFSSALGLMAVGARKRSIA